MPAATQFSPFAGRCSNCLKWTIYRCQRCSAAYFCSRACQREVSSSFVLRLLLPFHSFIYSLHQMYSQHVCHEREFRLQLNYDKIEARHVSLMKQCRGGGNAAIAETRQHQVASTYPSMNPMHRHSSNGGSDDINNTPYNIHNAVKINLNTGLSNVSVNAAISNAPAEVEMVSWYDRVKQGGADQERVAGTRVCEVTCGYDVDSDLEVEAPPVVHVRYIE